jgi:hypothetical protein
MFRCFYPQQTGYRTPTHAPGTRGIITSLRGSSVDFAYGTINLLWQHITSIDNTIAPYYFRVYHEGEHVSTELDADRTMISNIRSGVPQRFDVAPLSRIENDLWVNTDTLFAAVESGSRVRLTWTAVDTTAAGNTDFDGYRIYYDNGREDGNCDTLLDTVYGAENTTYTTVELSELTYTFALAFIDELGNEGSIGATTSITVNALPVEPDNAAATYNQSTRKVTISADEPAGGQSADVVGYSIYSNHMPGSNTSGGASGSLQPGLCGERWMRMALVQPAGGSMSYEVPYELFPGNWQFAIRALDGSGLESDYEDLRLTLVMSGSDLVSGPVAPDAPYNIDAEANAGGTITVTVYHNLTNATHIRFYRDSAQDNDQAVVAGQTEYTYTTAALTNGQEYDFYAVARNSATLSVESDTVSETADDTAPTGTQTLTAELVD